MTPEIWQSAIITLGTIVVGWFSYLASRRARRLAQDVLDFGGEA